MSHIFISYSRKDLDFAGKIVKALADNKLDTWIDWKSIPKGEDWEQEIYRGIEEAEAFLFLISPDSVYSSMCKKEIKHAVKNGKRIIPVVIRDTDLALIPKAVSKLNWIFCRDKQDRFRNTIKQIQQTIHTDYEWLKIHTKLQINALEWERSKNESSFLLHGKELQDIDGIFIANSGKDPLPTPLQRQFIQASRENEKLQQIGRERLRRNITVGLSIGLAITIILSVFALVQRNEAIYQKTTAQAASTLAVEQRATAQSEVIVRSTAQADAENQRNIAVSQNLASISSQVIQENPQLAYLLSVEALKTKETTGAKRATLENLNYSPYLVATLYGHTSKITDLVFSKSGEFLAVGDASGFITIHDVLSSSKKVLFQTNIGKEIILLQFLQNDTQIILGGEDGTVQIWDTKTNSQLITFRVKSNSSGFNYMGIINDHILVTEDSDWIVQSTDLISQNLLMQKNMGTGVYVRTTSSSQDFALALKKDDTIATSFYWFSPTTGNEIGSLKKIQTYKDLDEIAISDNHKMIATGGCTTGTSIPCTKGSFDLWDAETGNRIIETNNIHTDIITALAFSPDSKILASASGGSTNLTEKISILLWGLDGSQIGIPLYGHQAEVEKIVFSPNGRYLASGDNNGLILLWDLQKNTFYADNIIINDVKASSTGKIIIASGNSPHYDKFGVHVYMDSKLVGTLKGLYCYGGTYGGELETCQGTWINDNKISDNSPIHIFTQLLDDETPVVTVEFGDQVLTYNLLNGKNIVLPITETNTMSQQAVTRSGKFLIVRSKGDNSIEPVNIQIPDMFEEDISFEFYNDMVYVYDNKKMAAIDLKGKIKGIIAFPDRLSNINLVPENSLIFATHDDYNGNYSVLLWDLTKFSPLAQLNNQWFPAFSPTKDVLATVDKNNNSVNLWNLKGEKIFSFETKSAPIVQKLTFSIDGKLLAAHQWESILVWDISALESIGAFDIPNEVDTLTFSGDDKILVTGGCVQVRLRSMSECNKGEIQIWYLDSQLLSERACELAGRNMTLLEWKQYVGDEPYQKTCPQWLTGE